MPMDISILVASGDQDVADFLDRRLTTLGCRMSHAFRTPQAIAAVESREIHAALVGERLEDGPGSDVVSELRRRKPDLPIFFVTSSADEASSAASGMPDARSPERRLPGATRCVRCPTTVEALEELLEEALDAAAAVRDAARPRQAVTSTATAAT